MLSLFVMYSKDRKHAFDVVLSALRKMESYEKCQKTLVVDGEPDVVFPGWKIVSVPRISCQFSWANMWQAGAASARFEKVVYLDSDRVLPPEYLVRMNDAISDNRFVFTSQHYQLMEDLTCDQCDGLRKSLKNGDVSGWIGKYRFEPRRAVPAHGPGKNAMSGSTGFTRTTFWKLGGVDPWYRGHGAFADTDFHLTAHREGCEFFDLGLIELHCPHEKHDENGQPIDAKNLKLLGLRNFVYYCGKWKLPLTLAEAVAIEAGVIKPKSYIESIREELKASPRDYLE